jgi:hypothetical protein
MKMHIAAQAGDNVDQKIIRSSQKKEELKGRSTAKIHEDLRSS